MQESLQHLTERWITYKTQLVGFVGLTNDAMHIHGSLLILLGAALVLRRRPDNIWCWLVVLIAELFNEFADLKGMAPGEDSIEAGLHDLYNTMFWPTVIVLLGRFLFPPREKPATVNDASSSDLADQPFEEPPPV